MSIEIFFQTTPLYRTAFLLSAFDYCDLFSQKQALSMFRAFLLLILAGNVNVVKTEATEERAEKIALRTFFKPSNIRPVIECTGKVLEIENVEDFSVFNEKKLFVAKDLMRNLTKLPHEDMMISLMCLRILIGETSATFTDFVLRGSFITKALLNEFPNLALIELPPSYQTLPHFFFPPENLATNGSVVARTSTVEDPNNKLAWWAEDVALGEHHCNWHFLNNFALPVKHREGDLFAYMHLQMLARYDAELIALGMAQVVPYGPGYGWDKPLPIGYNSKLRGMSFRPRNMRIEPQSIFEGELIAAERVNRNKENLYNAIARGYLEHSNGTRVKITMDILGNAIEANKGSINSRLYGNIHNDGHNIIGSLPDPLVSFDVGVGVMTHAATAPRDPVFFRWHKFVDNFFEAYRKTLQPYRRKEMYMDDIKVESVNTITYDLPDAKSKIDSLYTFMERGKYTLYDLNLPLEVAEQSPINIYKDQMNHFPYKINITVNNTSKKNKSVIFRVFVAPKSTKTLEEWRNMFIELDKFVETVRPGRSSFSRLDKESSVVVQSETTMKEILDGTQKSGVSSSHKCGWPSRLVIPRGSTKGMDFDLYVIATDWAKDRLRPEMGLKNGISYCGNGNAKIADSRPMGFPFDRPFVDNMELGDLVKLVPNSASSDVTIKFLDDYNL